MTSPLNDVCVCVCVQTLQDKVCEFQARLRSEEVSRHLLLQQLQQQSAREKTSVREPPEERPQPPQPPPNGETDVGAVTDTQDLQMLRTEESSQTRHGRGATWEMLKTLGLQV